MTPIISSVFQWLFVTRRGNTFVISDLKAHGGPTYPENYPYQSSSCGAIVGNSPGWRNQVTSGGFLTTGVLSGCDAIHAHNDDHIIMRSNDRFQFLGDDPTRLCRGGPSFPLHSDDVFSRRRYIPAYRLLHQTGRCGVEFPTFQGPRYLHSANAM